MGGLLEAKKCGYELNADYNASKNIARKLAKRLHPGQKSSGGGATYQLALASGILNLNGEFHDTGPVAAEGKSPTNPILHERGRQTERSRVR